MRPLGVCGDIKTHSDKKLDYNQSLPVDINGYHPISMGIALPSDRTTILIHCSQEEAARIRAAAAQERRTISGYVINAVMSRIEVRERALANFEKKLRGEPAE
jgi:rubrerythrin